MPAKTNQPLFDAIKTNARRELVPVSGFFELTPRCSLDCKMCYVHLTEEQMCGRKELPTEAWIKIIDEAVEAGLLFAVLTGGECMMHKGFREIYLHMREKGVITMINTNATLFNEDNLAFFAKYPPNTVKITLYGASEDGYERVTGHRQFERVKTAILRLKDLRIPLKLAITICKYSYDDTIGILKFAVDNNIPYVLDMAMYQAEEETGRNVDDYGLTADEIASKYREIAIFKGEKPHIDNPITELPKRLDDSRIAKSLRCSAGRSAFTIKWDGHMQCCLWVSKDAPNVLEEGFAESWKKITQVSKEYPIPAECVECPYTKACHSCAVMRADPNDPRHCNPQICEATIAKINAGIYGNMYSKVDNN